jgi:hypothetical protein
MAGLSGLWTLARVVVEIEGTLFPRFGMESRGSMDKEVSLSSIQIN